MNTASASILIRHATPHDAGVVTELLAQLGYSGTVADVRRRIESLQGPEDAILVAEIDRVIVGVASLHRIPLFHTTGCITRITSFVVDEGFHRRGVGKALLEQIDNRARETGCQRIEVTSGDHRTGAHAFYQAMGYDPDQRRFIRIVA